MIGEHGRVPFDSDYGISAPHLNYVQAHLFTLRSVLRAFTFALLLHS